MLDINELIKEAHETSLQKGWHDEPKSFGEIIALCHSELSEALEAYRDGLPINQTFYGEGGKPEGIPSELADTVIRIFDACGKYGIDLEKAIREKMDYNKTRGYKHGGKVI